MKGVTLFLATMITLFAVAGLWSLIRSQNSADEAFREDFYAKKQLEEEAAATEFLAANPPIPREPGNPIAIDELEIGDCISVQDVSQRMSPIEDANAEVTLANCSDSGVGKIFEMTTWEKGTYWRGTGAMGDYLRLICPWKLEEQFGFPRNVFYEIKWGFHWDTGKPIWHGSQPTFNAWRSDSENSVYCIAFEENFGLIQTVNTTTQEGITYSREMGLE